MAIFALALSILALFLGPLLVVISRRRRWPLDLADGFVLVSVVALVLIEVLPLCFEAAGAIIIPLALVGLLLPTVMERLRLHGAGKAHNLALYFGILGLCIHGVIDGAGLSLFSDGGQDAQGGGLSLTLAITLHRLPEGLAIWWLLRPTHGRRGAFTALIATALATLIGFGAGSQLAPVVDASLLGSFGALLAGALLHVVMHGPTPASGPKRDSRMGALGALLGALLVYVVGSVSQFHPDGLEQSHSGGILDGFLALSLESAPYLLLAYVVAGFVHALLPKATIDWISRGRSPIQAIKGLAFALPLPICSCGILPIYRGLVGRGVPLAAAMTLLVAAPELGFDAVFLSVTLLDGPFAIARVVAATLLALLVGIVLARWCGRTPGVVSAGDAPPEAPEGPLLSRLTAGLRVGLGEMVDATAPWILVGLLIAAFAAPLVEKDWIGLLPPWSEVPFFALLGLPVYVCASGATPLAAVLVAAGASPGAALAFLLTGPATNVTTFGVLTSIHGRRTAVLFALLVGATAILLGIAVNIFLPTASTVIGAEDGHIDMPTGTLAWTCLGGLGLLFLLSLARQGPRVFLRHLFSLPDDPEHCDDPCHSDSHSHG
ncbi:MAG TPA: hypothetical protein EYN79_07910 [Planctomycetes bacterium]|nr:hypothetical protein [Planctomycetota bacterium]HIN80800.1 hypothetical protein [Planctomycetota bacterium]